MRGERIAARLENKHGKPIKELLAEVLNCCGSQKLAAEHLGISYSVMNRLVSAYLKPEKYISIVSRLETQYGKPIRQILVETLNSFTSTKEVAESLGIKNIKYLYLLMKEHEIEKIVYYE